MVERGRDGFAAVEMSRNSFDTKTSISRFNVRWGCCDRLHLAYQLQVAIYDAVEEPEEGRRDDATVLPSSYSHPKVTYSKASRRCVCTSIRKWPSYEIARDVIVVNEIFGTNANQVALLAFVCTLPAF